MKTGINVIAAVRNEDELSDALSSGAEMIFCLSPDLFSLSEVVKKVHSSKKKIFIHIDLAEGIGKDRSGLEFCRKCGVDGIISTRVNMIKTARELGLFTVQRFFIVDSHSISTTIDTQKNSKADMIEIMPGTIPKVLKMLKQSISVPIIAGGLIETEEEVFSAFSGGASAVSTGKQALWKL